MEIFLVGGAVRDQILGLPISDRDWVVTGATEKEMIDLGHSKVGQSFPVFLHRETKDELALARKERKTAPGYNGFECEFDSSVTLEEDLFRRDLTINAIAIDKIGTIIDPHGGQQDIENRILRHVSESFVDDPLRVLRVARFASRYHELGFTVDEGTLSLMKEIVTSGELDALPSERIVAEINKAFKESSPSVFFEVLRSCGALKEIMPEVDALFGVPQRSEHHPEICTGVHTMMVVDQVKKISADLDVSWMALLHDLGKALTPSNELPAHIGHESTGVPLVHQLCRRLGLGNELTSLCSSMAELHLKCHKLLEMQPKKIHSMIKRLDGIRRPERVRKFALACEADARGRKGFEDREYPQSEELIKCALVAKEVSAKPFVDKNLRGLELGEAIRVAQIDAIRAFRKRSTFNY